MFPNRTLARGARDDPTATVPRVGGAIPATSRDFRLVGAGGSSEVPLATGDYEVWAAEDRRIQGDRERDWCTSVQPGPNAGGEGPNVAQFAECAPRALCGSSVRGLLTCPAAPGRVGFPSTMGADASSALSRPGYKRSEVAFGSRGAGGFLPVRLAGTTSCARPAAQRNIAQKTGLGYLPCCASATNVATFPMSPLVSSLPSGRGFSPFGRILDSGSLTTRSHSLRSVLRLPPTRRLGQRPLYACGLQTLFCGTPPYASACLGIQTSTTSTLAGSGNCHSLFARRNPVARSALAHPVRFYLLEFAQDYECDSLGSWKCSVGDVPSYRSRAYAEDLSGWTPFEELSPNTDHDTQARDVSQREVTPDAECGPLLDGCRESAPPFPGISIAIGFVDATVEYAAHP